MRTMWRAYGWMHIAVAFLCIVFVDETAGEFFISTLIFTVGCVMIKNPAPETIFKRVSKSMADWLR